MAGAGQTSAIITWHSICVPFDGRGSEGDGDGHSERVYINRQGREGSSQKLCFLLTSKPLLLSTENTLWDKLAKSSIEDKAGKVCFKHSHISRNLNSHLLPSPVQPGGLMWTDLCSTAHAALLLSTLAAGWLCRGPPPPSLHPGFCSWRCCLAWGKGCGIWALAFSTEAGTQD